MSGRPLRERGTETSSVSHSQGTYLHLRFRWLGKSVITSAGMSVRRPPPVKAGKGRSRWRANKLQAWCMLRHDSKSGEAGSKCPWLRDPEAVLRFVLGPLMKVKQKSSRGKHCASAAPFSRAPDALRPYQLSVAAILSRSGCCSADVPEAA